MIIDIKLSDKSILHAIERLNLVKENIQRGLDEAVDVLAKDGAIVAQAADGSMAYVDVYPGDESTRYIMATGDAPIIAEFGAGDATLDPTDLFTNHPPVPVYPGSYSESENGSGMYAEFGWWKFGGKIYTQIEPRQGLYKAKQYILENAAETVKEVIEL